MNIPTSRFSDFTNKEALCLLVGALLLIIYGFVSINQAFPPRPHEDTDGEDARMYASVIKRVHAGESYYQIVGEELRTRGYASRPFFNWRLPTMAWTIGHLPRAEWGKWILLVLSGISLLFWFQVMDQEVGFRLAVVGSIFLCGPFLLCFSEQGFYYHELWAGVMISLSLAAHARGYIMTSIITGTLAVFIRELALPFVLIMLFLAWKERRQGETLGWLTGVTAFSLALTYHASIVSGLLTPDDQINRSWVQFNGWPFVLSTGNWNVFLLIAPQWVVAIVLPLALLGMMGRQGAGGMRSSLTLMVYLLAFLVAGRTNNAYWGMMYAPLVSLGFLYAIPSLVDLAKSAYMRASAASG